MLEGGTGIHTHNKQTHQPDRQDILLTQRVLGGMGEDEYFALQESACARKSAEKRQTSLLADERERARDLHFMKCPKCGAQLGEIAFGEVSVDKCFSCDGLWLDKGELDLIRQKDDGFMARLLGAFGG